MRRAPSLPEAARASAERVWAGAVVLAAAAFLAIRLAPDVRGTPLFEDEAIVGQISVHGVVDVVRTVVWDRGGAPLHFVAAHVVLEVVDSAAALRWLSVAAAVATVPVTFDLGRRLRDTAGRRARGGRLRGVGPALGRRQLRAHVRPLRPRGRGRLRPLRPRREAADARHARARGRRGVDPAGHASVRRDPARARGCDRARRLARTAAARRDPRHRDHALRRRLPDRGRPPQPALRRRQPRQPRGRDTLAGARPADRRRPRLLGRDRAARARLRRARRRRARLVRTRGARVRRHRAALARRPAAPDPDREISVRPVGQERAAPPGERPRRLGGAGRARDARHLAADAREPDGSRSSAPSGCSRSRAPSARATSARTSPFWASIGRPSALTAPSAFVNAHAKPGGVLYPYSVVYLRTLGRAAGGHIAPPSRVETAARSPRARALPGRGDDDGDPARRVEGGRGPRRPSRSPAPGSACLPTGSCSTRLRRSRRRLPSSAGSGRPWTRSRRRSHRAPPRDTSSSLYLSVDQKALRSTGIRC